MSLPVTFDKTVPANGDSFGAFDNKFREFVEQIEDVFGIPDATAIAAAGAAYSASGLTRLVFQDLAGSPNAAGQLARNGTSLEFHNGAARTVYTEGGTDIAVADGGTGLSAGTSGGVLAFTGSTTLASSAALTAKALVLGGGAGAVPTSASVLTSGQLYIGSTGADPVAATLTMGTSMGQTTASGSITLARTASTDHIVLQAGIRDAHVGDGDEAIYMGVSTENVPGYRMPVAGTITAAYTRWSCDGGVAREGDGVIVVKVNGSGSNLSHSFVWAISSPGMQAGSATGTVSVSAGDYITCSASDGGGLGLFIGDQCNIRTTLVVTV